MQLVIWRWRRSWPTLMLLCLASRYVTSLLRVLSVSISLSCWQWLQQSPSFLNSCRGDDSKQALYLALARLMVRVFFPEQVDACFPAVMVLVLNNNDCCDVQWCIGVAHIGCFECHKHPLSLGINTYPFDQEVSHILWFISTHRWWINVSLWGPFLPAAVMASIY